MRDSPIAVLRSWARRPQIQDVALTCGLLLACLLLTDVSGLVHPPAGQGRGGAGAVTVWWAATALTAAAVMLRRRWPVTMLAVCSVSAAARVAVGVLPTVMDLAVLVLLGTVAARCSRLASLLALGAVVLLVAGLIGTPVARSLRVPNLRVCNRHVSASETGLSQATVPVVGSAPSPQGARAVVGADPGGAVCKSDGSSPWRGFPVLGSALVAAWAVGSGNRNRRAYLEQLHARAQDLERARDREASLAVADERGRISREVHDVVAHGLSLIVVQAQGAEAALDNRPDATRAALRTIVATGRDSLADMRRVLAALGEPDGRDGTEGTRQAQPGLDGLPALLARVRQSGTPVRLRVEGTAGALPSTVDLSAYRIVQEALTNVMKHAGPGATADVALRYADGEITIEISDDGAGAGTAGGGGPWTGAGPNGGNGLPGMRRRVMLLGGRCSAGPGVSGGFAVHACLPIHGRSG
ncbi:sensor histidine kinase [Streptomyces sp. NPDC020983]|uniref:sensor histidine kinase n=1 Tax=Streptomyces sp. NPDC020983 TaxID=3365106 RepID=UPI00379EF3B5